MPGSGELRESSKADYLCPAEHRCAITIQLPHLGEHFRWPCDDWWLPLRTRFAARKCAARVLKPMYFLATDPRCADASIDDALRIVHLR